MRIVGGRGCRGARVETIRNEMARRQKNCTKTDKGRDGTDRCIYANGLPTWGTNVQRRQRNNVNTVCCAVWRDEWHATSGAPDGRQTTTVRVPLADERIRMPTATRRPVPCRRAAGDQRGQSAAGTFCIILLLSLLFLFSRALSHIATTYRYNNYYCCVPARPIITYSQPTAHD